jgi:hypothetical protein
MKFNKVKIISSSLVFIIWIESSKSACSNAATFFKIIFFEPDSWIDSGSKSHLPMNIENHATISRKANQVFGLEKTLSSPAILFDMKNQRNHQYPSPHSTDVNWRFDLRYAIQNKASHAKVKSDSGRQQIFNFRQCCIFQSRFH